MQNQFSVIELSRGSVWKPLPEEPPYLIAPPGQPWLGLDAYINFYDSTGSQIVPTIEADSVTLSAITFCAEPEVVDLIPAGATFEIYLETPDGPRQIRYGKVIRRQAIITQPPPAPTVTTPLLISDSFPTLGLRSSWKPVLNRVKVYDNPGTTPNSMATDNIFFDSAAVRWENPLNSDSPRMHAQFVASGAGKTTAIVAADQRFTTGLGVQFETGIANNRIHLGNLTGPTTLIDKVAPVDHTLNNLDDYFITYSDVSKTLAVYQGTSLSPIAQWPDALAEVPHGLGYRYVGFSWIASLLATGPQVCSFSAKDDV